LVYAGASGDTLHWVLLLVYVGAGGGSGDTLHWVLLLVYVGASGDTPYFTGYCWFSDTLKGIQVAGVVVWELDIGVDLTLLQMPRGLQVNIEIAHRAEAGIEWGPSRYRQVSSCLGASFMNPKLKTA
jgi:hypothetical protein